MIVGIVLAVAAILFLYWFFGTEIGSAMRATGNNEDMVRALGVDTRMTKLLSLMVSNGLVALSGALCLPEPEIWRCWKWYGCDRHWSGGDRHRRSPDGTIDLFYWKLTSVVVGSVIYFVIRAVVLPHGYGRKRRMLLSAVIVALALCVPVALAKYRLRKDYSEGGEE
ncbi:MAG: ABC transporter permease subunit [Clostridium fessum]